MTAALVVLLALVALYVLYVRHEMAKPVTLKYNHVRALWLKLVLSGSMRAISLWRTCWLLYPPSDPRGKLTVSGWTHEKEGHIENPEQWAGHPYLFPFMYLWEQIRRGYDKNKYEQQARKIAGEPLR